MVWIKVLYPLTVPESRQTQGTVVLRLLEHVVLEVLRECLVYRESLFEYQVRLRVKVVLQPLQESTPLQVRQSVVPYRQEQRVKTDRVHRVYGPTGTGQVSRSPGLLFTRPNDREFLLMVEYQFLSESKVQQCVWCFRHLLRKVWH